MHDFSAIQQIKHGIKKKALHYALLFYAQRQFLFPAKTDQENKY